MKVIYEQAFRRMLKKPPVLLVGGFQAWKSKYPSEVSISEDFLDLSNTFDGIKLSSSTPSTSSTPPSEGYMPQSVKGANGLTGERDTLRGYVSPSMTGARVYAMDQIPEDDRCVTLFYTCFSLPLRVLVKMYTFPSP